MPFDLAATAATSSDGKIYVSGGSHTAPPVAISKSMCEYDPILDPLGIAVP